VEGDGNEQTLKEIEDVTGLETTVSTPVEDETQIGQKGVLDAEETRKKVQSLKVEDS
jgi:uncharacterized protein YjbK